MEEILLTVATQFPNLAVALWVIFQQQTTIKKLMDNQQRLIERLLTASEIDDAIAVSDEVSKTNKATP